MEQDDAAEAVATEEVRVERAEAPPPDPLGGEREALAAERAELERDRALARDYGRVEGLNARVAAFDGRDWDAQFEADPQAAQADWIAYMRARDDRDRLVGTLQADARREHVRRVQQAHAEVSREIKDWSPELARRLTEFGRSIGFSDEELGAITDVRQIKVLHAAWREQQGAAAERLAAAQKYAPVPTVRGASGRAETAPDTDDFRAFERFAAQRLK